jgi:hypothetical protein
MVTTPDDAGAGRNQSKVSFPYTDISDAIAVAEGLMKGGGMPLGRDQLAAAMNAAPGSGSFNVKLGTARAFAVMETVAGKYQLTELGFEIVDPARQRDAMVRAFLSVELYRKAFEEFKGKLLPPRPHGLEAAFVRFGVSPKQKEKARVAFDKSARAAGFFPNGNEDRLVMPFGSGGVLQPLVSGDISTGAPEVTHTELNPAEPALAPAPAPPQVAGLHRSILGMLDELPPPKTNWDKGEQADWLQALATMFQVIYKSEDKGSITINYAPD